MRRLLLRLRVAWLDWRIGRTARRVGLTRDQTAALLRRAERR
jgi:hypothetical protein